MINRAARRQPIFLDGSDYRLFERLMAETADRVPIRLLAYVVMPNHWHLVLRPFGDSDLPRYMQHLTRAHAQSWHLAHRSVGTGALYQGRFKAIPVQDDGHFLTLCAYVERNPARAGLVSNPTEWRWGSAWTGPAADRRPDVAEWPFPRPADWIDRLTGPFSGLAALEDVQERIQRGLPFGSTAWTAEVTARLQLSGRARGRGRPPRDQECRN